MLFCTQYPSNVECDKNSQSGLRTEVEVRERKNEFGNSEEVFRAMELVLLFHGQPIQSTGHDGLPICLTG